MAAALIPLLANILPGILDKVIPDKNASQKVADEIAQRVQEESAKALSDQRDINKIEAASPITFVSGWRPFIGWVCGAALALYYIPFFLVGACLWVWASIKAGVMVPRPEMGIQDILGLLGALLGLGTLRTYEKKIRVAK